MAITIVNSIVIPIGKPWNITGLVKLDMEHDESNDTCDIKAVYRGVNSLSFEDGFKFAIYPSHDTMKIYNSYVDVKSIKIDGKSDFKGKFKDVQKVFNKVILAKISGEGSINVNSNHKITLEIITNQKDD